MNSDIKKRIDAINNTEAIQFFFSLLKTFLQTASITETDERLAITIRNDYRKRFSVNLNSRLILFIKDGQEFGLMINNTDLNTITQIPVLRKEVFEKQTPEATLVSFDFEVLQQYIEILKPLWLKSCLEYLPSQIKSQYRKHHVDELYKIAINEDTLNEYLAPATDKMFSFPEMINDFRIYLKNEDNILKDFIIFPVTSNSRYVWISDSQNILNDTIAHYEIIVRREKIYVEIHFEGNQSQKDRFSTKVSELPDKIKWFTWNKSKSIRYDETYTLGDEDILQKLAKALLYLEENLGDQLRKIKNEMNTINVKEDFLRWLIATDGVDNNYFTQQFGAKIDRLKVELNEYEEVYKKDFDAELFVIDFNNLKKQIETIKTNIYGKSIEFAKYSEDKSNDRPRAILGKKNYLKFLNEYFANEDNLGGSLTNKNDEKMALNQILFGPPGTGKTYTTIEKAIAIANPSFNFKQERKEIKAEYNRLIEEGQIVFTTFHQSMSYEDFIEGIKPETLQNDVVYNIKNGIFKNICQAALTPNQLDFNTAYDHLKKELSEIEQIKLKTPRGKEFSISLNSNDNLTLHTGAKKEEQGTLTKENIQKQINGESKFVGWEGYFKGVIDYLETKYNYTYHSAKNTQNFVLIIDEINRGNVSAIFGELITLIEDDKRLGKDEALEVILPYSKAMFGVPPNLYIIGTMNTADRSVEALDTALRRRFCFEEIEPDSTLIATKGKLNDNQGIIDAINLPRVLETINNRIEILSNRDHKIGHSYFMKVESVEGLRDTFKKNIIPLLQEYFYNDYEKIGWVLGEGFFEEKKTDKQTIFTKFFKQPKPEFELGYQLADIDKIDMKKAMLQLLGDFKEETQAENSEN